MAALKRIARWEGVVWLGAMGLALGMAALVVAMLAAAIVAGAAIVLTGLAWLLDRREAAGTGKEVER